MRRLKHTEIAEIRKQIQTAQGNRCALCGVSFSDAKLVKGKLVPKYTACLDHDHDSGHIRGVLCNSCNGMDGKIKNRVNRARKSLTHIEWLTKLLAYWIKHEKPNTALIHPTHKTEDEKRLARNKKARQRRARAKAAQILKGQ